MTTESTYTIPESPADPETAALELVVRIPTDVLGKDSPPREALQDFTSLLHPEGCFAGMSWHDVRHAATVMIVDAINHDDLERVLRVAGRKGVRQLGRHAVE